MDSSGEWMFLEPDEVVLFSEWVTSDEVQRTEKSPKPNRPHPSALLTLLLTVFSLEKSNVWMLLLRDTACGVHLYQNNFRGGSM